MGMSEKVITYLCQSLPLSLIRNGHFSSGLYDTILMASESPRQQRDGTDAESDTVTFTNADGRRHGESDL